MYVSTIGVRRAVGGKRYKKGNATEKKNVEEFSLLSTLIRHVVGFSSTAETDHASFFPIHCLRFSLFFHVNLIFCELWEHPSIFSISPHIAGLAGRTVSR